MKHLLHLAMLLLVAVSGLPLFAQMAKPENFPVPFGPTNLGKEFFFSLPTNYEDPQATQQYIRLYITSAVKTRVNVWVGESFKKTLTTIANDVVTFDFTKFEAQVVNRGNSDPVPDDQVYRKKAIFVESDAPIVLYVMNRTSFTSDGMLALPVNGLGNEYVVASATDVISGFQNYLLPSQYVIVAPYDGTSVTIKHSMNSPNHPSNADPFTFSMDRLDVFSAMSSEYNGDLSGTYIYSNKPIAVMAGENCTFLPDAQYRACDHLLEMMFPTSSWGKLYHSMPFATRVKGDLYRVFAGEPDAKVYINGDLYATIPARGGARGYGWIEYLPPDREPMEFTSDKRIYVAQYNNSQTYDGIESDPFYLVLTPVEQYQKEFIFTTPSNDYPKNYINIVCDSAALRQIEIAVAGTEDWKLLWQVYGGGFAPFPTKINGMTYVGKTFEIAPGTYKMRGPRAFAAYIYGFGTYDSYGYPLSAALADLTRPDKDPPKVEWKIDCEGNVEGTTIDLPDDEQIRSNLSTIWLDADTNQTYNYQLTVDPLFTPGATSTSFRLRVIDRRKNARAVLIVSDRVGHSTVDTIYYSAFDVSITPDPAEYGNVTLGGNRTEKLTITNNSPRPVTITGTQLQKGNVGFKILTQFPPAGIPLGPSGSATASTTIDVEFTATRGGTHEDSVGISDSCGLHYISLVRAKVGAPIIKVSDKDWGPVVVGTLATGKIEVSNVSADGTDLTVTGGVGPIGYPGSEPPIFTSPDGLPPFPFTLKAGERRSLNVTFQPDAEAYFIDSIVFSHDAPPNPANDSVGILEGSGIQAVLFATSYDWDLKRVGKGPFPSVVYLVNAGTTTVRINGVASTTGDQSDFTIVDPNAIVGRDIAPGDSLPVDVTFNPTAVGDRRMEILYAHSSNQASEVKSVLTGKGTRPGLITNDLDFQSMVIGAPEKSMKVRFTLDVDPNYPDTVAITGFRFTSDQVGGTPDFRMDPQPPVVLTTVNPFVELTGYFSAQAIGLRNASVTAITNDEVDTTSRWIGLGASFSPAIVGSGDMVRDICINDSALLIVLIENTGTDTLKVGGLRLRDAGSAFTIVSPNPNVPFELLPQQRQQIVVRYKPTAAGVVQTNAVVIANNSVTPDYEVEVSGSAMDFTLTGGVVLTGGALNGNVELGKEMMATVVIDQDVDEIKAGSFVVTLTYDPKLLMPRSTMITPGKDIPAGSTITVDPATTPGTLIVRVISPELLTGKGELLQVPFGVLFTRDMDRSIPTTSIAFDGVTCARVASRGDTIAVEEICGLNLRMIEMFSSNYSLGQNSPNPFNPVTTIPYSLGLDGPTRMMLFDATGGLVQILVDEHQQPGKYELTLDVSNLASGNYYYQLVSGAWSSKTMMLTVVK